MATFHYIALSQDQRTLRGIIEAPDEAGARQKLNDIGLSVISLTQAAQGQTPEGKNVYEFEAFDKNSKKVVGTITAESPLDAYVRLFEEYQLNVVALYLANLKEEEKKAARQLGTVKLQEEYSRIRSKKQKKVVEEESATAAMEATRRELLGKVDFTMQRIEQFLQLYSADLKTEERQAIQAYLNQLIRIKDSTNLEHIRSTCERMLAHLQSQELFLHEEQKLKESAQLKVETRTLLKELNSTGLKREIDITKIITRLSEYPIVRPIAQYLLHSMGADNPEIQSLRSEVKSLNNNLISYIKLLFTGHSKTFRHEAWNGIVGLLQEKKRLKNQIRAIKIAQRAQYQSTTPSFIRPNARYIVGWILSFYLIAYVVSYPFTIKDFGIASLPQSFFFYTSTFAKPLTLFFFILYGILTIHDFWLTKKTFLPYALYPLGLFTFLLVMINLM